MTTKLAPSPAAVRPPRPDAVEVLMTLSLKQYAEMGEDIERLRERLDLPKSASNTDLIREAIRRQARAE